MRGADVTQENLFVTRKTSDYVPADHPLMAIRDILNRALRDMDLTVRVDLRGARTLLGAARMAVAWAGTAGAVRDSQRAPVVRATRLQMLYRWFVGLSMDDAAWDHSTYTKNRDRLIEHEVVRALFGQVMQQAKEAQLLSDEHFSVDGTLIRAWASHKSFVPKDGPPPPSAGSRSNPEVDFKGNKRSNETHASTTDPDAKLFAKSHKQESIPAYLGHVLMENRSKLAVDTRLTLASGTAEPEAALAMLGALPGEQRKSVGADKNFDTTGFVTACRDRNITPHVAQNAYEYDTKTGKRARRKSRIDGRTTRHPGYAASQVIRKMIETLFGDGKQHGGTIRQVKLRGRLKVSDVFTLAMLAVNLRRLPGLLAAQATMVGSG